MPSLMIRQIDSQLLASIKALARKHKMTLPEMIMELLRCGINWIEEHS